MPDTTPLMLWQDAINHGITWLGGGADERNMDRVYAATRDALHELCRENDWRCHWTHSRVSLEATYSTGTAAYDHTGGASERLVTLAGSATVPTNADYYNLRIGEVNYKVEDRKSSTTFTLTEDSNPGADVAATSYSLFRSEYVLAHRIRKLAIPIHENWYGMCYVEPDEVFWGERQNYLSGQPRWFSIVGNSHINEYGSLVLWVHPAPSANATLDFMYLRWPRPLKISGLADDDHAGTVTTSGTALTGSGTAFTSNMVGSVIRFGTSSQEPTSYDGRFPPQEEATIAAVASTTAATLASSVSTYSGVKYVISDPIDIDQALFSAYKRRVELELSRYRDYKVIEYVEDQYKKSLMLAFQADNRRADKGVAMGGGMDYPLYDPPIWAHQSTDI